MSEELDDQSTPKPRIIATTPPPYDQKAHEQWRREWREMHESEIREKATPTDQRHGEPASAD